MKLQTAPKPFKTVNLAHKALGDLLDARGNTDVAGSILLLDDTTVTPADGTNFKNSGSSDVVLAALGVPVLFTAEDPDTLLVFNTLARIQMLLLDSTLFDNISVAVATDYATDPTLYVRVYPSKDFYFGPMVKTPVLGDGSTHDTWLLDGDNVALNSVDYKIYNGDFEYIMLGDSSSTQAKVVNLHFGNGTVDSKPYAKQLYTTGLSNVNSVITAQFRSGTVYDLRLGKASNKVGKIFSGDLIYRVYSGVSINQIVDYTTNALGDKDFFGNMARTLVFDGYVGSIKYVHGPADAAVNGDNGGIPNGLDAIAFLNGANVTFTENAVRVVSRSNGFGNVYVDETSSFGGLGIVGSYYDTDLQKQVNGSALEATSGTLYTWHGSGWMTDIYGKSLGAQVRVEAPYGIRFGFMGSTAALEAMVGQKVTEKGVLIIRSSLLAGDLTLETENSLKIVANKAFSLTHPNLFTGVLVDTADASASSEAWLQEWKNVNFTARAYFTLADGSVIYTDTDTTTIQDVLNALN